MLSKLWVRRPRRSASNPGHFSVFFPLLKAQAAAAAACCCSSAPATPQGCQLQKLRPGTLNSRGQVETGPLTGQEKRQNWPEGR